MSDLSTIRAGLKTVVEAAISGLTVYPTSHDGPLEYPCLRVIRDHEINYALGAIGSNDARMFLPAMLYLNIHDSAEAWAEMDEYLSPTGSKSIRAAVWTDPTLNGSCTFAEVVRSSEVTPDPDDKDRRWEFGARFDISIIANIS